MEALVKRMTKGRTLGVFGMPRVNVLAINMELDKMADKKQPAGQ
jgi:K+-transporting ATPase c subunit